MLKMLAAILMAVGLFFGFGESDGKDDSDSRSKVIPQEAADAIKKDDIRTTCLVSVIQ